MDPNKYISHFIKSFLLLFMFGYILSITLVYPKFTLFSIWLQIMLINLYGYFFQYETRKITNVKKSGRTLIYVIGMLILLAVKYALNIKQLSYALIAFIGLWNLSTDIFNKETDNSDDKYNFGPPFYDMLFGTLNTTDDQIYVDKIKNGIIIFLIMKLYMVIH